MREEQINRRITESIDQIPVQSLRQYLKDRLRFERSKMDSAQPYFKNSYRDATTEFAPDDPSELDEYDAASLTEQVEPRIISDTTASTSQPIQIHEVRMEDWRQYAGETTVKLSAIDDRLINVIEGPNGAGKSNFLNAITLCLYGQERQQNLDPEAQPYVTQSRIESLEPGEPASGFIEVVFGVAEPEYRFRRDFTTLKREDGTYENSIGELELRKRVEDEWELSDTPASELNKILPARVADYFLFDGEDLDVFFEEGYSQRVEEGILDMSHLELLDRAVDHLDKIRDDYESEAGDMEGEAAKIRTQLEEKQDALEMRLEELDHIELEIEETQHQISEINDRLKDLSDEYVKTQFQKVNEKQEQIATLEAEREVIQSDIKDVLTDVGPTVYAADALLDAHANLDVDREAGQLPPQIQREFISNLLERGECICGRPVEAHSEEAAHLEELQSQIVDVSGTQFEDASTIPRLFDNASAQIDRLIEKRQEAAAIEDDLQSLKREVQDVESELQAYKVPDENVEALESNRDELEQELNDLHERRAQLQVDIDALEQEKEELQAELQEELQKEEKHREILAKLSLVSLAADCLTHIREAILDEIRARTEANMEEYINQLIWKDEHYEIQLNDDYSIAVRDEYGENKMGSLSAGETQILALSFMAALSQISGFDAPVVIDTPLGRISKEPRREIATNLPNYMSDTQITFLMTDAEYTNEVRELMADEVGREYRLVYEDAETSVVERDTLQEVETQ